MVTSISNGEGGLDIRAKLNSIWEGLTLNEFAASKAVTAVDVFVYDTRFDSDGGAWRDRCQHTSWYNETLNTATRGSRREFPAVAVIVAEAAKVTIYDGDDPALPMWMVFNGYIGGSSTGVSTVRAVTAFNGEMNVATNGATNDYQSGLPRVRFVKDVYSINRGSALDDTLVSDGQILNRNVLAFGPTYATGQRLVSGYCNDVAMTALPDAPIDPATGLPVPTIAVATDGGVSVINNDGTVADSALTLGFANVSFDEAHGLWYSRNTYGAVLAYASVADYLAGDGFGDGVASSAAGYPFDLYAGGTDPSTLVVSDFVAIGGDTSSGYSKPGLMFHAPNYADQTKGMSCLMTSTYLTGWMNGDIKGAFLADTDATNLVASGELVTNGTFDSDTDWTKGTGWSIGSGVATGVSGTASFLQQSFGTALTTGKTYAITFTVAGFSGTSVIPHLRGTVGTAITANGTYTVYMVAGSSSSYDVAFYKSSNAALTIDNVSVKLADEDRSVNGNGLVINGTITRSPVATGAELVAYSGFSASNYLEQPYNADLDFGTGDFCVMGWATFTADDAQVAFHRTNNGGNDFGLMVLYNGSTNLSFRLGTSTVICEASSSVLQSNSFRHVVFMRKNGVFYYYLDGALRITSANTGNVGTGYSTVVGRTYGSSAYYWKGGMALWRISATAPSAEQIAKIYEDEKFLFQENSDCTLYGSSDAVTALSHDPVTDLLHVGTSAGRSVIQGLRRVDNTTTAVTTAISAVDELVLEQ